MNRLRLPLLAFVSALALAGSAQATGFTGLTQADGVTAVAPTTPLPTSATSCPPGYVTVADHANVAAGTATVNLAAAAGVTNYLTSLSITGGGATSATLVVASVTNLAGGIMQYAIPVPAGATLGISPIIQGFSPAIPASAANTAVTLTVPSFGTGNTNVVVAIHGCQG